MTIIQRSTLDQIFSDVLNSEYNVFNLLYPPMERKVWEPVHIVICDGGSPLEPVGAIFDRRDSHLPELIERIEASVELRGLSLAIMGVEL